MGNVLYIGHHGSENPARAVLPFLAVSDAIDRGQQPVLVLMDEAVFLVRDAVADVLQPADVPPLRDLLDKAIGNGVPIYVCDRCSASRGVTDADYRAKNGREAGSDLLAELSAAAEHVYSC